MLLLWLACAAPPTADPPVEEPSGWPTLWTDQPCEALSADSGAYADTLARWTAEEALYPTAPGQLVVVGSSSIRRWEAAFEALSDWGVVQRGFGGAQLQQVAQHVDALVVANHPAGVLLFAGTNDVAAGASAEQVVTAFRCFADRTWSGLGEVPILFVGMTPTPARWAMWDTTNAANQEIAALAEAHPGLHYIDIPSLFLATGSPPDPGLFVDDGLHLNAEGYALWTGAIRAAVAEVLPPLPLPAAPTPLPSPTRVRVDLGPSNAEDGAHTTSPDPFGLTWNNWHDLDGGGAALPGETLGGLIGTRGEETGWSLVITGGFLANGLRNGGLTQPDGERLGTLAVAAATEDFFYVDGPDNPGGFAITGLDPQERYTLRLFASRASAEEQRVSRYTARGSGEASVTLITTGGPDGEANQSEVAVLADLAPNARGQLFVDVAMEAGAFAYLSLFELEQQ